MRKHKEANQRHSIHFLLLLSSPLFFFSAATNSAARSSFQSNNDSASEQFESPTVACIISSSLRFFYVLIRSCHSLDLVLITYDFSVTLVIILTFYLDNPSSIILVSKSGSQI
jgi:hypothetical protein